MLRDRVGPDRRLTRPDKVIPDHLRHTRLLSTPSSAPMSRSKRPGSVSWVRVYWHLSASAIFPPAPPASCLEHELSLCVSLTISVCLTTPEDGEERAGLRRCRDDMNDKTLVIRILLCGTSSGLSPPFRIISRDRREATQGQDLGERQGTPQLVGLNGSGHKSDRHNCNMSGDAESVQGEDRRKKEGREPPRGTGFLGPHSYKIAACQVVCKPSTIDFLNRSGSHDTFHALHFATA